MTGCGKLSPVGGVLKTRWLRGALLASTTLALFSLVPDAQADGDGVPQYWQGGAPIGSFGGSGIWSSSNRNWADQTGHNPNLWLGGDGVFQGTAGTVTLQGTLSFNRLEFAVTGYLIFDGDGPNRLTTGTSGSVTLQADSSVTATIDAPIRGAGGLTKTGAGTIIVSDHNTYTGATTVSAGTLQAGAANVHPFCSNRTSRKASMGCFTIAGFLPWGMCGL